MTGSTNDSGRSRACKKNIPGFPGYMASEDGRIFSERTGALKQLATRKSKGYLYVNVRTGYGRRTVIKMPVHQLVLLAFVGDKPGGHYLTRHLNGNPLDNRLDNLKWGTPGENTQDSIRHRTAVCLRFGERAIATRLTDAQVIEIEQRASRGEIQSLLANEFGISQKHVSDIKLHRTRKYLWYPGGGKISAPFAFPDCPPHQIFTRRK
ncbi:HNH endonuclease signature motif containing protein [Citrobacter sedlakii]|uniref:HNH endonuclease signature motif containing protein n=1 Tax=Citrobacter sedlakii TaxID=67826 RepID=UPI00287C964E|nr:HNH endonuclease [Salmonella enterica]HDX5342634.1 HNH endonuclease [Citrobacter sedlakii]